MLVCAYASPLTIFSRSDRALNAASSSAEAFSKSGMAVSRVAKSNSKRALEYP